MKDKALARAVNLLNIALDHVELAPYVCYVFFVRCCFIHQMILSDFLAYIQWELLPPGFKIKFTDPVAVKYNDDAVLEATVGEIASETPILQVPLSLPRDWHGQTKCVARSHST